MTDAESQPESHIQKTKNPAIADPVLTLDGEMTIFQAAELKSLLLDDPRPLQLDLSGVTEIDTAGIQLLMQAKKMALQSGVDFKLLVLSPEVTAVFDLLNLHVFFEAPTRKGAHES